MHNISSDNCFGRSTSDPQCSWTPQSWHVFTLLPIIGLDSQGQGQIKQCSNTSSCFEPTCRVAVRNALTCCSNLRCAHALTCSHDLRFHFGLPRTASNYSTLVHGKRLIYYCAALVEVWDQADIFDLRYSQNSRNKRQSMSALNPKTYVLCWFDGGRLFLELQP